MEALKPKLDHVIFPTKEKPKKDRTRESTQGFLRRRRKHAQIESLMNCLEQNEVALIRTIGRCIGSSHEPVPPWDGVDRVQPIAVAPSGAAQLRIFKAATLLHSRSQQSKDRALLISANSCPLDLNQSKTICPINQIMRFDGRFLLSSTVQPLTVGNQTQNSASSKKQVFSPLLSRYPSWGLGMIACGPIANFSNHLITRRGD